jgi:CheY-like chemotaxis protein
MERKKIHILLVEDNPGDIRLVREALNEYKVTHHLEVIVDGVKALNYLQRKKASLNGSLPDLILLDLNMPKKDGREVLKEIKQDVDLRPIPVIIFSSSKADEDIRGSYDHHANCYVCKPLDLDAFIEVVGLILRFWLDTIKLPSRVTP